MRLLATRPKESLPFLRDRLRPVVQAVFDQSPEGIARLIADLDADAFGAGV